jgi:hypothetical protein
MLALTGGGASKVARMTDRGKIPPRDDEIQEEPGATGGDGLPESAEEASVAPAQKDGTDEQGQAGRRTRRAAVSARLWSGAEGAARGSVGVVRGGAAVAQRGAELAEQSTRVTYWPAAICVLAAIALQVRLPEKLTVGPGWLMPSLEAALLIGLVMTTPRGRVDQEHPGRRRVAIGLIAFVNVANALSLYLLAHELLHKHVENGRALILSGIAIWLTNVLIFALWYWQLDRGGPGNRARHPDPTTPQGRPDFVFPEMDGGLPYAPPMWTPGFVDYLALSLTTATAFSPTDTMPITSRAKALMSSQGLISLVTLGLIISRAVGILG